MATDDSNEISGVDDQKLAAVAGNLPELPNIRADRADRFAQSIRALVEKRAQNDWPNESEADEAVFVMVDHPRRVGEQYGAKPFVDPIAKQEPLLGHLFFANQDASAGRFMQIPVQPDEILDWLDGQRLGDLPTVIVYRQSKQIITRPTGAGSSTVMDPIRDQAPTATLPELEKALEHFHRRHLLTPACCAKGVWEPNRAHEYVPGPRPEQSIQSVLLVVLNSWFHGIVRVDSEVKTNIGRIDLALLRKNDPGQGFAYWVIMELKVIKSFSNASAGRQASSVAPSTNVNAIVSGIKQVGAYRENLGVEEGLLEIYDFRQDKMENLLGRPEVSVEMDKFTPPLQAHTWPLYGSSQDARNAGYTGH